MPTVVVEGSTRGDGARRRKAGSMLVALVRACLPAGLRLGALDRTSRAYVPVLGVLEQQIGDTSTQIESAVASVCSRFQSMAGRARTSVERTRVALAAEGDTTAGDAVGGSATQTLEHLLDRLERCSALSLHAVEDMERVNEQMRRVRTVLDRVERIAMSTQLLAINAAIEAARVGEQGRSFAVVADEMARVAAESGDAGQEIRGIVDALLKDVGTVSTELRDLASSDVREAQASRAEVERALAALTRTNTAMRAAAADASSTSDALATDIAQAVVALQFQDMVSQRLGHVVETLHDMGAALAGRHAAVPLAVAPPDDHLTRMASRYTMAHERESQSRGLGLAPTGTEAPTGSVELF